MTSNQITNLTYGDYDVTITDAEGSEVASTFSVGNLTGSLSIDSLMSSDASCVNNDGSLSSYVTGGAQPHSYSWSNGSTQTDITNTPAGTHTLTVTDDNNCIIGLTAEILNPLNTLEISYSYVSDADCGSSNGWISFDVSGGMPPYSYNWNTPYSGTQNQYGLAPGNYYCVITDANGCSLTSPVYNVASTSGTFVYSDLNVDHEVCFDAQGRIAFSEFADVSGTSGTFQLDLRDLAYGVYFLHMSPECGKAVHRIVIQE